MIFQHTWQKVLSGEKTQTRRIVRPDDLPMFHTANSLRFYPDVYSGYRGVRKTDGTYKWQVGKTYAVQPGRGKPAVARIRLTVIRREDVRDISDPDIEAEGFDDFFDFFDVWTDMHDHSFNKRYLYNADMGYEWDNYGLAKRPAERYQAWALTFEVQR